MKLKQTLGLLLCVAIASVTHAQVTIGSDKAPIDGALLDLKENGTTTKGLGMPRVSLSDLTKLKMGDNEILDSQDGGNQYEKHIGLIVYQAEHNVTTSPAICKGLYVWDGIEWQSLPPQPEQKADITMTDVEGNIYNAKWFTNNPCDPTAGAYWTTSNLYCTQKGSGGAFTSGQPRLNRAYRNNNSAGALIAIPSTGIPTGTIPSYGVSTTSGLKNITGQSYMDFVKEYGLLYNWAQANEACPTGWHLPTVQEWDDLIDWHGGKSGVAPSMRKASTWKYYYTSADSNSNQWGAVDGDTPPVASGFDTVPSGYGYMDGNYAPHFGQIAYFWTATSGSYNSIGSHSTSITVATNYYPGMYYSVRCVQDN